MSYSIVTAIGESDHLTVQLAIATALARARGGRVVPLYVATRGGSPS